MKKIFALVALVSAPLVTLAQSAGTGLNVLSTTGKETNLDTIYSFLKSLAGAAVTFITTLAVLYFLWGVFQYVANSGNPETQAKGRSRMIAGIIGLAVMVSVNGLVYWVTNTAGTSSSANQTLPTVVLPSAK